MTLDLFFLSIWVQCSSGILLTPLENNDKLKDITKQFVAEWQWESWPIKQESSGQDNQSPGPRINAALWKEPSKSAWYLFGGQPVGGNATKVYSDVWKYTIETRTWEKFFPQQSAIKNAAGKTDGMVIFRTDLLDEIAESKNVRVFLCGNMAKINATKPKKPDLWLTLYGRKKPEEKKEELKSLAVYVPWTSKPSTVWQMDVKDNLWTAYVCCCDEPNSKVNNTKSFKNIVHRIIQNKTENIDKNNTDSILDSKINKIEDEIDNSQQHLNIKNLNKKKRINQNKKGSENLEKRVKFQKKRNVEQTTNETLKADVTGNGTDEVGGNKNYTKGNNAKKEKFNMKLREEQSKLKKKGEEKNSKKATKYCPDYLKGGAAVTWCDGRNEALITTDFSSSQIVLWVFNLQTTHWTKLEVKMADGLKWPLCADMKTIRYADTGEEVYLLCTPPDKHNNTSKNSTNPFSIPQKDNYTRKLVFRINYKEQILDGLGEILLNSYFGTPEGEEVWRNTTKSTLQAVKNPDNETILILAYSSAVDLWVLAGDPNNESFEPSEKIWRGSALKWFDKYNAAFYNLQFVSEDGKTETVLIRNPRTIPPSEYWGRERGRFIIRIFKNENLKNQSFENRTREQNLTYELLQSDNKPSGAESRFSRTYTFFIFFGISLVILKIFVFAIFIKRVVKWSRKMKIRGECRKSPLIIRYSVIPDDMLQPVT